MNDADLSLLVIGSAGMGFGFAWALAALWWGNRMRRISAMWKATNAELMAEWEASNRRMYVSALSALQAVTAKAVSITDTLAAADKPKTPPS